MFIKPTRSGGHTYLQLVESYRNEEGKTRQRTIATLGRLDESGGGVDALLGGILRAKGLPAATGASPQVAFESALALGDVWALDQLWKELGFDRLGAVFRKARYTSAVEHAVRAMVFNRLCEPDSKLGVLRWLETVSLPGVDTASLTHQHLLRSMDALMNHQDAVDDALTALLRPMVDQDLSLVFYDLTTIRAAGLSEQTDDVRQYGMSKEGLIARQFMLGVVQTAEGLPIYHEVFDGNQCESATLLPTLKKVLGRFPHIKRLIVVADRGLLSIDIMEELSAIKLPSGQGLEFILAVPGRRYSEFADVLQAFGAKARLATDEIIEEVRWRDRRLVVAHHPHQAMEQTQLRNQRIAQLQVKAQAELMDGKLLLVTNVPELTPQQVVQRYKSLADIERGFRVLKSEIEIAPVYHRLPERIRAHAMLCFMALIIYRVMRQRLKMANSELTPERALAQLRRIQSHRVSINAAKPIAGISVINDQQASIYASLKVKKPAQDNQTTLL